MILPRISIKRPVLTVMMNLALILFGAISLSRLPVRELPDIDPPIVSVTTVYPGANASVVETEVSERLEEQLNNIEGIRTLSSQSREQVSTITLEFDLSRDIDQCAQDVRDRVSRVRGRLPESIDEPIVAKQDADAQPIIWIGVNSDVYTALELTLLAEKQMKNRLQTVRGVSGVIIGGEKRYAMRLWLDSEKMAAHQLTVLDIERALRQQNVELPSGRVENLQREMTIQTRGQMKTPEEFNDLVLRHDGAKLVHLHDVGEARSGVENERTVARNNGRPCIFLGIVKQSKANTVEVADGIMAEVARLKPTLPEGIELVFNYDESTFVRKAISEVWTTLSLAFVLVVLLIWLFLGSFRSTLIPSVAIPVSIIGTFAILHAFGYSVNILTMLALVLAIGVVVDDAIVVLENIHRHVEQGLSPMQAAFKGMEEISFAVIAITLSLIAVFTPLAFVQSATGRLFVEFAVAVAGSVAVSAFVALTLSPMMAARVLREHEPHSRFFVIRWFDAMLGWFTRLYARLLQPSVRLASTLARPFVRWPFGLRLLAGVAFAGLLAIVVGYPNYFLLGQLEGEFLPEEDKGRFFCFVFTPEGSTLEYTDRQAAKMEAMLKKTPEVEAYGSVTAFAQVGPGQVNQGIVFVRLQDPTKRKRDIQQIVNAPGGLRQQFFEEVEGAIAVPNIPKAIGRSFGSPFQLVIQAQDLDQLSAYTDSLLNKLRAMPTLVNARSSYEVTKPELRLAIDRSRAAALGVSIEDVSRTLQILFGSLDLSRIKLDGKEYDVIAQLQRTSRLLPQDLDRIYVRNQGGQLIQLSAIVRRSEGATANAIEHYNRLRSTTISASLNGVPLGTAIRQVEELLKNDLPPGFLHDWAGESREFTDSIGQFLFVLILALVITYMVLAAQFESLVHPVVVILCVPLAGFGALGLLWLVSFLCKIHVLPPLVAMNINLFSLIGFVLLVGLVTKNGILLVEFANQRRAAGIPPGDAMLEAGKVRLRPILMTAFSTIAGILPVAIGFGAGAESRRPMGIVVVGGMLSSTILTLWVIPMVYTFFSELAASPRHKSASPEIKPASQLAPVK
ncbi:MAG TPA: efflux RND transporter permease subunit [Verrucomicrobiae bacterium]|nr:efflux RND transporter permease subunit [Verrucomicrobiae bacterium]